MNTVKTYRFPVDVRCLGEQLMQVTAAGKPELTIALPPQFRGGVKGEWTPEDLLVAAVASCYAVTLDAVAAGMSLPLRSLEVRAAGDVTRRVDSGFRFSFVELDVSLETDPGREAEAYRAAELAEQRCLVSASLDVPVYAEVDVRATPAPRGTRTAPESPPRREETEPFSDPMPAASGGRR